MIDVSILAATARGRRAHLSFEQGEIVGEKQYLQPFHQHPASAGWTTVAVTGQPLLAVYRLPKAVETAGE